MCIIDCNARAMDATLHFTNHSVIVLSHKSIALHNSNLWDLDCPKCCVAANAVSFVSHKVKNKLNLIHRHLGNITNS